MINYLNLMEQLGIPLGFLWLFVLIIIWSAIWKGIALWKSARNNSPVWFIVLLLVNTVGILEILYIYVFSKCCKKRAVPRARRKRRR